MSAAVTSVAPAPEQAQSPAAAVTGRPGGTPVAERVRQHRQRAKLAQQPMFSRNDWSLLLNPATIAQVAGCQPARLCELVLREVVDNALDAGANVEMERVDESCWIVADDGPGLDPVDVPRLFAINRVLLSTKQLRRPTRGMVGHGLRVVTGAVAASGGTLVVETRGHRLTLAADPATGLTEVTSDEPVPVTPGLTVRATFGPELPRATDAGKMAAEAIRLAGYGRTYDGPSSPHWYSASDFHRLLSCAPPDTTVADVAGWFAINSQHDERPVQHLDLAAVTDILETLQRSALQVYSFSIGRIGAEAFRQMSYHSVTGDTRTATKIPYRIECWATCRRSTQKGVGSASIELLLNRTPSTAKLSASSNPDGLEIMGCGLVRHAKGKTGHYTIVLSLITPYIALASMGKEPALSPFGEGITAAISKACALAHNAMAKPEGRMTIVEAAEQVMVAAYRIASAGGTLPANARQIYYAARPGVLQLTGRSELSDSYFTQNVLPDYIDTHPDSHEWDVVYDDRGHFAEPHTGRTVGLGTIAVRQYLGERQAPVAPAALDPGSMADTAGPENRYRNVLFIEKEGFGALLAHTLIAERFDLAIASSKGMSNTALRQLLDGLVSRGMERVFVVHDFDASGFSIFGTLGTDSRRYTFDNRVKIVDLGLRLSDVKEMGLPAEAYEPGFWDNRQETLAKHGASDAEIDFLSGHRVELNAMPSDVFIQFLERKLTDHGVKKLVPDENVIQAHARHVIERALTNKALEEIRPKAYADASLVALPNAVQDQVAKALEADPPLPWDLAAAKIATDAIAAKVDSDEWNRWSDSLAADLNLLFDDGAA